MADCHICGTADAVAVCHNCRRLVCEADKIEVDGQVYCKLCESTKTVSAPRRHTAPSVDFLQLKRYSVLRTRYPAIEFSIRLLAVLSYVALAVGVLLCLTYIIMAAASQPAFRRILLTRSVLSLTSGPVGFIVLQTTSQLLRLLVDIEKNSRSQR